MKNNKAIQKFRDSLIALGLIALVCGIMFLLGIPCPIKYITGISCAGCGMTRAWISVFRGNFANAFYYHPLYPIVPFAALALLFQEKLPKILFRIIIFTIISAFVIVYVYRLIDPSDNIVVFQPSDGLLYRIISLL